MLNEIGKEHQGILTGSISVVQKLFENWRAVSSALTVVISTIGAYKAMQALANIETLNGTRLTIKQTLAEVARARATQGTAAATLAAARAQGVLNRALAFVAANPYAAVAAGAVALLTTFAILLPKAKSVEEQIEGLDEASTHLKKSFENLSNVEDLISQYDNLQKTIRTTQETIDAYADSSEKSAKNNKDLETAVNSNKEAHNQLDKVMSKLVDATTPAIISK